MQKGELRQTNTPSFLHGHLIGNPLRVRYYQVREYDSAVAMLENAHSNGNSSLDSRCLLLKLYGSTANWWVAFALGCSYLT